MADDPKPGTPGGTRSNYDGWDVVYVDGKYIKPDEQKPDQPKSAPKKTETRFGKRGVTTPDVKDKPVHTSAEKKGPEKTGSEIVREVRARLRQQQGKTP
ncbi:MAG: hypothetical protein EP349_01645 [Alphaproteobacteria bacterium]|nr:MAG: hypothetical protein EP349_01645 [Alphaproteobacteria bacterium]